MKDSATFQILDSNQSIKKEHTTYMGLQVRNRDIGTIFHSKGLHGTCDISTFSGDKRKRDQQNEKQGISNYTTWNPKRARPHPKRHRLHH